MELTDLPPQSAPLPWQADSWSRLGDALERDSFPHALLLAGSPGIGKTRLALALARRLLCHRPSAGINCGACQACELTRSGAHGDFRWLQPDADSRVIKIDQVRALVDFGHSTAGFGPRKVMVIAPADVMNTHAANALLKSLEEPPANTHLLLVCDRLHGGAPHDPLALPDSPVAPAPCRRQSRLAGPDDRRPRNQRRIADPGRGAASARGGPLP